jgi:hypothetical protein
VRHVQQCSVRVIRQQCQLLLWQVKQLQQAALAGISEHLLAAAAAAAAAIKQTCFNICIHKQDAYATAHVLTSGIG